MGNLLLNFSAEILNDLILLYGTFYLIKKKKITLKINILLNNFKTPFIYLLYNIYSWGRNNSK